MKYIFSLVIFLVFGQIFSWYDDECRFRGRCRRKRRRCHRRYGCGYYGNDGFDRDGDNEFSAVRENAFANSNSISINTGDNGIARSDSTANAFNVADLD